ncbi:hypothetical protein [Bradyrhizobium sp. S69]|uniref:hypothetical protein n=1 Tax=Bradyrhizobium sp. S69 TaxID=1641856 RepID=UPI00131ECB0B|nr:hypothetical protein [Bradyrhizobium sp. S69]
MRKLSRASLFAAAILLPAAGNAGAVRAEQAILSDGKASRTDPIEKNYRGYYLDLSKFADRQDFAVISEALHHQIDIVENVGLSPRVLGYFRTVPIVANELSCLEKEFAAPACYGPAVPEHSEPASREMTVWDGERSQWINKDPVYLASDVEGGIVMVRPILKFDGQNPVILHELLHAFHNRLMPQGFQNPGILVHYNLAKSKQFYPADAYVMTDQKEFFAVTASVFLYGKDDKEPFTREKLKAKQPDYYKYLVGLFEFDPDRTIPVASATLQDITGIKSTEPILPGMSAASK